MGKYGGCSWDCMGMLPSGGLLQFAVDNGPVEIVGFPTINGESFHRYVSLPEGI